MLIKESEIIYKGRSRKGNTVSTPHAVYNFIKKDFKGSTQEKVMAIVVNNKNVIVTFTTISIGTISESLIHPREIFKIAIRHLGSRIILVHNHPSGNTDPSAEDINITIRIIKTGKIIGIPLLDHIIVANNKFISLKEERPDIWSSLDDFKI